MPATSLNISDIQLFTILKEKLGEKEAEQLVAFVKAETQVPLLPLALFLFVAKAG